MLFYRLLFFILCKNNIWILYKKYHENPSELKKRVWNEYMERHSASISIDAQIKTPLILPHGVSGIFITQSAKIGSNVVVFQQVTIGANTIKGSKSYGAPVIEDNVFIHGYTFLAHDNHIGAHSYLSGRLNTAGFVTLGKRNFACICSVYSDHVKTADDVWVGLGCIIIRNIKES